MLGGTDTQKPSKIILQLAVEGWRYIYIYIHCNGQIQTLIRTACKVGKYRKFEAKKNQEKRRKTFRFNVALNWLTGSSGLRMTRDAFRLDGKSETFVRSWADFKPGS